MEKLSFTSYIIDKDIKEELKKELESFNNILIIGGETSLASIDKKLKYALTNQTYTIELYGKECSHFNVERILAKNLDKKFDIVVGIGGGKALDTAKLVAFKLGINILTIPTIAATCAATSSLSVVYNQNGAFTEIINFSAPPLKTFIDLETLKNAPKKYIWAGMGDTLAKFYEVDIKSRWSINSRKELSYQSTLGRTISTLCRELILKYGENAFYSSDIGEEFKNVILAIIVNTGYTSNLVEEYLNGAIAHSVCYGLGNIHSIEKNHLHGELVAYGILIQLLVEDNYSEYEKLIDFYNKLKYPTKLEDFIEIKNFKGIEDKIIDIIINSPDMPDLFKMGFELDREKFKSALYGRKV